MNNFEPQPFGGNIPNKLGTDPVMLEAIGEAQRLTGRGLETICRAPTSDEMNAILDALQMFLRQGHPDMDEKDSVKWGNERILLDHENGIAIADHIII